MYPNTINNLEKSHRFLTSLKKILKLVNFTLYNEHKNTFKDITTHKDFFEANAI